jgi:hypothetical protein
MSVLLRLCRLILRQQADDCVADFSRPALCGSPSGKIGHHRPVDAIRGIRETEVA